MESEQYDLIASIEADHWWYRTTRWLIASLVAGVRPTDGRALRTIDLGAGTGAASSDLDGVIAVDRAEQAMARLQGRGVRAIRADAATLPIGSATADVVLAVNLLYSVARPDAVLAEAARVLAPGGAVVLVEPAFPAFERANDRSANGRRRFRRPDLARTLEGVGLEVRRSTYLFSYGAPVAAVQGLAYRLRPTVGEVPSSIHRPPLGRILAALASTERRALRLIDLPFGTSVAVLAVHRESCPLRHPSSVAPQVRPAETRLAHPPTVSHRT